MGRAIMGRPQVKVNAEEFRKKYDSNVARLLNCCVHCDSTSIVRRKKHGEYRCERCGIRFQVPVQREYENNHCSLPPCLKTILKKKQEERKLKT